MAKQCDLFGFVGAMSNSRTGREILGKEYLITQNNSFRQSQVWGRLTQHDLVGCLRSKDIMWGTAANCKATTGIFDPVNNIWVKGYRF
ncbi:Uncharacterized protein TCM_010486 [Theobroma cacao]|uniref:Uncharacterized protein n=1 Tax=Theobroma cacao TaxID=3641 RepID=A0A061E8A9_THECC|nr:Uncharacterized protein TCM_010486 [Theobroma cacao]